MERILLGKMWQEVAGDFQGLIAFVVTILLTFGFLKVICTYQYNDRCSVDIHGCKRNPNMSSTCIE